MSFLHRWIARLKNRPNQPVFPGTHWMMNTAWLCQAVYVVAKLDVAERLRHGPLAIDGLAAACDVQTVPLLQVMRALAGFGIFTVTADGRWALNAEARRLLGDDPLSVRPYALVCGEQLWSAAGRMLEQLRTGRTGFEHAHGAPIWSHYAATPKDADVFDTFMSAVTDIHVRWLTAAYPFARHHRVVDVGAGRGRLLSAMLATAPNLHGVWYDRAEVLPAARVLLAEAGVAARCEFVPGSFLERVPPGADLYVIKHVLHDEPAGAILKNIAAAMEPSSRLLVIEGLLDERSGRGGLAKIRDLEQMFWTGGRVRSQAEFSGLLAPAGLEIVGVVDTPIADMSLIHVRKRS